MNAELPAIAIAAVPGKRAMILDLAREMEERGFTGLYCASFGDAMGLCNALASATNEIAFGTGIVNIYTRHVYDYAQSAAFIHEISGGRFRFGIGVSHDPMNEMVGVKTGKPLADTRSFVDDLRGVQRIGDLPPVVLAGMRDKMVSLSAEVGDGVFFANAARSAVPGTLERMRLAHATPEDFFVGAMIPTCISDDRSAAAAVNRRTLTMYVGLPNYRNYWADHGYPEEMAAIEAAIASGDHASVTKYMTDEWLADVSLFGSPTEIRDGIDAWRDAGATDVVVVPSSAVGKQMDAFRELFAIYE